MMKMTLVAEAGRIRQARISAGFMSKETVGCPTICTRIREAEGDLRDSRRRRVPGAQQGVELFGTMDCVRVEFCRY